MTRVFCATYECEHCKDGRCSLKDVHLNRGCQDFSLSENRELAMKLLAGNVRGSDQKERMKDG